MVKAPEYRKFVAIKVVKEITGLDLAAAKDLVDNMPSPVAQGITLELAQRIQSELITVNIESTLSSNTEHDPQQELQIVNRMHDRWQAEV